MSVFGGLLKIKWEDRESYVQGKIGNIEFGHYYKPDSNKTIDWTFEMAPVSCWGQCFKEDVAKRNLEAILKRELRKAGVVFPMKPRAKCQGDSQ